MPVTLLDRLPLPNLKVYTAGSVMLLSVAVYYALSVTSDPNWRVNATLQRQDGIEEAGSGDSGEKMAQLVVAPAANVSRNITEQFVDVVAFMMQEPLCMWTLINIAYCALALFGFLIQRLVFGQLRVSEAQRVKDKFWNYVFYKFIFVFGVINVQYMDEVLLWCSWFTLVGFLHLMGQLCKDRFEYLSSSPHAARGAHVRLAALLGGVVAGAGALLAAAARAALAARLPAPADTFCFMLAECALVALAALHVVARYWLRLRDADVAGRRAYYTHLLFDSVSLVVELVHVVHMVVYSNMLVSMASLVLVMQLRHLLHELQARVRRHRLYTDLADHMSRNYPMASKEEVEKNQDNCAICWEPMKEARKLPCSHLFHNSCLCQWVQQDASCPTCRRTLAGAGAAAGAGVGAGVGPVTPSPTPAPLPGPGAAAEGGALPPRQPNHLFHFDGSRYVSWLPSFSVEVTRVRAGGMGGPGGGLAAHQIDAMARQVSAMFPQLALATVARDLAATRSADLTLDNILEGRLADPTPTPSPTPTDDVVRLLEPAAESATGSLESLHEDLSVQQGQKGQGQEELEESEGEGQGEGEFPAAAAEREARLRARRRALLVRARRRYLATHPSLSHTAPSHSHTTPSPSHTTPSPSP